MAKDVQLVSRIASILGALSEREAASLVEISSAAELPLSTTSRLLDSLEREGFVERDYASKRYCFGRRLLSFAAGSRPRQDLASVLHPTIDALAEETGEDTGIAELHGKHVVLIDRVEGRHALRIIDVINKPEPLYCGAFRKVLLAFQTDAWIEEYLQKTKLVAFTPDTIRTKAELRREIAKIRRQGFATSFGERLADAAGVAAPIFDQTGRIRAAVQLAGPKTRINAKTVRQYTEAVKKAGEAATRLLCGRRWNGRSYSKDHSAELV
jgi:DNA-binding IclR family transcriptional regulator